MDELKPCPFCGGSARQQNTKWVACECGSTSPIWNTRAPLQNGGTYGDEVAVAWQCKRRPEDYPDEWRECGKATFDTVMQESGEWTEGVGVMERHNDSNNGFWDRDADDRANRMRDAAERGGVENFFDLPPEDRAAAYDRD